MLGRRVGVELTIANAEALRGEQSEPRSSERGLVARTYSAENDDVGLDLDAFFGDDLIALDVDDRIVLQKGNLGVVEGLVVSTVEDTTLHGRRG